MADIPEVLKKPLDEIKTASNRILIICLVFAIIAMASVITFIYAKKAQLDNKVIETLTLRNETAQGDVRRVLREYIKHDSTQIDKLERRVNYLDSLLRTK